VTAALRRDEDDGPANFTCPACGGQRTRVIDSRPLLRREGIWRRRECRNAKCRKRFTTYELVRNLLDLPNIMG
jgi:transcriptional regulator NrdR family protein